MRFIKYQLLLLLIIYSSWEEVSVQAQNKIYPISFDFVNDNRFSRLISPDKVHHYSFLKGIPLSNILYQIYSVTIDEAQDNDTSNKLYLYVGLDEAKNNKNIILDINNNKDFSDDRVYSIPFKNFNIDEYKKDLFPQIEIDLPENNLAFQNSKVSIFINPFEVSQFQENNTFSHDMDKLFEIIFQVNSYATSNLAINERQLFFNLTNARIGLVDSSIINNNSYFLIYEKDEQNIYNPMTKKIGDTIYAIGQKLYLRDAVDNILYIDDIGIYDDSCSIGSYIPQNLYLKNIESDHSININELVENKYVFIDFWGSWCRPCITSLPHLVRLYQKIKNRKDVLLLGFALENKEDANNLKRIIYNNDIEWLNLWGTRAESRQLNSIFSKLKVTQFPTYIILDKSGRIVYRDISSFTTDEAIAHFLDLIQAPCN